MKTTLKSYPLFQPVSPERERELRASFLALVSEWRADLNQESYALALRCRHQWAHALLMAGTNDFGLLLDMLVYLLASAPDPYWVEAGARKYRGSFGEEDMSRPRMCEVVLKNLYYLLTFKQEHKDRTLRENHVRYYYETAGLLAFALYVFQWQLEGSRLVDTDHALSMVVLDRASLDKELRR